MEAALPWLYLKGVSTGEMGAALEVLVGPEAKGLSASTVSRLKRSCAQEYQAWREAPLDRDRWVDVWADGIYSGLRAESDSPMRDCTLFAGVKWFLEREKTCFAIIMGLKISDKSRRERVGMRRLKK